MRKLLIIISIITSSLSAHAGYSIDSALVFADNQYSRGNYRLALKEYQRVSYYNGFDDPYLQFKQGNCHLHMGDWANARNYYDQVIRTAEHDSLLRIAKIKKISSLIREGAYNKALIDLYGVPDSVYQEHTSEIDLLFAITHFGLEEFDKSEEYFRKMVPNDSIALANIDALFNNKKLLYRPNPKLAYALSIILPGLGQFYSGGYGQGFNSFLLNEALVLLAVYVAFEYALIDAILSVLPWYNRYYMGGLDNAKEIATKERQKRRSQLFKQSLDIVKESSNM